MRQHGHVQKTVSLLSLICICTYFKFDVPLLKHKVGAVNPMPWHMNKGFGGSKKLALSNAQPSPVSNSKKRWPPSATSRTHRNLLGFTEAAWVGCTRMVGNIELSAKPLGIYLRGRDLSSRSSINGRYLWQTLTNIHACHSHDLKPCDFLPIKKAPRMAADVGDMQGCKLISNILRCPGMPRSMTDSLEGWPISWYPHKIGTYTFGYAFWFCKFYPRLRFLQTACSSMCVRVGN